MTVRKFVAGALLSVGLAATGFAQEATDELKFSSFLPASTVNNAVSVPEFIARAEELSGGALAIRLYAGGSLVSGGEVQLKMVQDGIADIAEIPIPYTPGRIKGLDVFELPNLAQTNSDGSLATIRMLDEGVVQGMDDLVVLGVLQAGPYFIHTKDEIAGLRDLRGKKLRVSGQMQAQIVARLGAVPVSNIPATGLAENISRGLIDGALVDTGNLYNFGVGDLVHYHVTNLPLGSFSVLWAMSRDRYDSLSDESKKAIDELRGEWFTTVLGQNMDKQTADVTARLEEAGDHHFVEFSAEDIEQANGVLQQVVDGWIAADPANADIHEAAKAALGQ